MRTMAFHAHVSFCLVVLRFSTPPRIVPAGVITERLQSLFVVPNAYYGKATSVKRQLNGTNTSHFIQNKTPVVHSQRVFHTILSAFEYIVGAI